MSPALPGSSVWVLSYSSINYSINPAAGRVGVYTSERTARTQAYLFLQAMTANLLGLRWGEHDDEQFDSDSVPDQFHHRRTALPSFLWQARLLWEGHQITMQWERVIVEGPASDEGLEVNGRRPERFRLVVRDDEDSESDA